MRLSIKPTLENIITGLADYKSRMKIRLDRYLDWGLTVALGNSGVVLGADKTLDWVAQNTDKHEGIAMLGTYAGLGIAAYELNKHVILPAASKISKYHKNKLREGEAYSLDSFFKTGAWITALYFISQSPMMRDAKHDIMSDGHRVVGAFSRQARGEDYSFTKSDMTPSVIMPILPKSLDLDQISDTNIFSERGRFLRTFRFDEIISKAEDKYGIEEGLLAGMVMHESCGNPLSVNVSEGSAGLLSFMPGTAKEYGLRTYGRSDAIRQDPRYGEELGEFASSTMYDYRALSFMDERFDVYKTIEAGARMISNLKGRYGSWDKAVLAFNQGSPNQNPAKTRYVSAVRRYQQAYLESKSGVGGEGEKSTGPNFYLMNNGNENHDIFRYVVKKDDNAGLISIRFNRWDRQSLGDKYAEIGPNNIYIDDERVSNTIIPGQVLKIKADKR